MIRDFFDKRASSRACGHTWLDSTFVAAPATVTAVLAVSDQLTRWLSHFQSIMLLVHVVLPLLALCAMAVIISSTTTPTLAGFETANNVVQYRFCQAARQTAKVAFFLLLAVAAMSLFVAMPNRIRGVSSVTGYVCTATGEALNGIVVQLVDRYGAPISPPIALDDRGFFFAEAAPWKTRPVHLQLTSTNCKDSVQFKAYASLGQSCPNESVESPQTGSSPVWITQCR